MRLTITFQVSAYCPTTKQRIFQEDYAQLDSVNQALANAINTNRYVEIYVTGSNAVVLNLKPGDSRKVTIKATLE